MTKSVAEKLRIKEGMKLISLNAPAGFKTGLGKLPAGATISNKSANPDQLHWFVKNRAEMEKQLSAVIKQVKPGVTVWVYYPKGSSGIQTDLTRDKGWDKLLQHDRFTWISLISFDDTWSVFGFRLKTETDKKQESKTQPREIFNWVDPVKKSVLLPNDLAAELSKHPKAIAFFDTLSFTNKKEYIEWLVTARRAQTRELRLAGTIERLLKGWKNPANR